MRILIIQMARLGDILQTASAIAALKQKHGPDLKIELIVRSTFASAAKLVPNVDRVIEFPSHKVFGATEKPEALAQLIKWLALDVLVDVEAGAIVLPYDEVINLTFSESSSFLASLIPAKKRRGMQRALDQEIYLEDSWSQYFYSVVLNSSLNTIHLNDLFCRIADAPLTSNLLPLVSDEGLVNNRELGLIGIQVGASIQEKTLSSNNWVLLCRKILQSNMHHRLIFFGSVNEVEMIENIANQLDGDRLEIAAGRTKFEDMPALLSRCSKVISPDTSIIHLASLYNVPVINLSVGKVRPEETGPYGQGHDILIPSSSTTIEELCAAVTELLGNQPVRAKVIHARTKIAFCVDNSVRCVMAPVNYDADESSGFFAISYYLLAEFRCGGRIEETAIPKLGSTKQPDAVPRILRAFDALVSIRKAAEFGQHFSTRMLKIASEAVLNRTSLNELFEKISSTDAMLKKIAAGDEFVSPLISIFEVQKNCASQSADLTSLIEVGEGAYRELIQNVEIIQNLLQSAVEAAQKPKNTAKARTTASKDKRSPEQEKGN